MKIVNDDYLDNANDQNKLLYINKYDEKITYVETVKRHWEDEYENV